MRHQIWYVFALIAMMCLVRFSLAAFGYLHPVSLMEQLGAPLANNPQMPYMIKVWAIRDIVLALLVIASTSKSVKPLLVACISIDLADVLSAHMSGASGMFNPADTWSLKLTAIAALVPESIAFGLMTLSKPKGKS